MPIDPNTVPKKSWKWNETAFSFDGVHTFEGKLTWFTQAKFSQGSVGAKQQDYDDFLQSGPVVDGVPQNILKELKDFLHNL